LFGSWIDDSFVTEQGRIVIDQNTPQDDNDLDL